MQRNIKNKKSAEKRTVVMYEGDPFEGGDPQYEQVLYSTEEDVKVKDKISYLIILNRSIEIGYLEVNVMDCNET